MHLMYSRTRVKKFEKSRFTQKRGRGCVHTEILASINGAKIFFHVFRFSHFDVTNFTNIDDNIQNSLSDDIICA